MYLLYLICKICNKLTCLLTLFNLIFSICFFFYKTFWCIILQILPEVSQHSRTSFFFVYVFHWCYILIEPLSMFITYIPRILWKKRQMRMKEMYFQRHIASEILVVFDYVLQYAISLSLLVLFQKSFEYIFECMPG